MLYRVWSAMLSLALPFATPNCTHGADDPTGDGRAGASGAGMGGVAGAASGSAGALSGSGGVAGAVGGGSAGLAAGGAGVSGSAGFTQLDGGTNGGGMSSGGAGASSSGAGVGGNGGASDRGGGGDGAASCQEFAPCTPANACHLGTTSCQSGVAICNASPSVVLEGSPCGGGKVCTRTGDCIAPLCVPLPGNVFNCDAIMPPCHLGHCDAADLGCSDLTVLENVPAAPNGYPCGANKRCEFGNCVSM